MIIVFEDVELEKLILEGESRRYKALSRDKRFMSGLSRVYDTLMATPYAPMLKEYSFLHYERLKRNGLSSVRILNSRVERLLFREMDEGISITVIELDDTHYGNKK